MFADESGDVGLINSPTRYFALTGLVLHELRWRACLESLLEFRKEMRAKFDVKLREEFHAGSMLSHPKELARIPKHRRLEIIRLFADKLASMPELNVISVLVDKHGKAEQYDVFENAWKALIQRFENTITHHNFPGPSNPDDRGILICDNTDGQKLTRLFRKMGTYNPVPNQSQFGGGYRNLTLKYLIEDPVFRDSKTSQFIQAADLAAFLVYQHTCPSSYMRRKSGQNYLNRLQPILCLFASRSNIYGTVRL